MGEDLPRHTDPRDLAAELETAALAGERLRGRLVALGRRGGDAALERFCLWCVEDLPRTKVSLEILKLRRAADGDLREVEALRAYAAGHAGVAVAATTIGIHTARDPGAATVLAAFALLHYGERALERAASCARMYLVHEALRALRIGARGQELGARVHETELAVHHVIRCLARGESPPAPRSADTGGQLAFPGPEDVDAPAEVDAAASGAPNALSGAAPEKIIELGYEGGGVTIYGRRYAAGWIFSGGTTEMDIDDDDVEHWRGGTLKSQVELGAVLPPGWERLYPMYVHPAFKAWFREERARVLSGLSAHHRASARRADDRWKRHLTE